MRGFLLWGGFAWALPMSMQHRANGPSSAELGRLNGLGGALAATLLASLAIAVQPAAAAQKVFPFANCTTFDATDNVVTAVFSYYSSYDDPVEEDIGSDNYFTPSPPDQGQTTLFFPGANFDAFEVSFASIATPSISWNLNGFTSTADTSTVPECTITADGQPQLEESPAISGAPLVGRQLSAYPGLFKGWVYRIRFQWQRQNPDTTWSDIGGATGPTYVPTATDAGRVLRVEIKADSPGSYRGHPGAAPAIVDSAPTSAVAPAATAGQPKISGITIAGQTLRASTGTWTGVSAFRYDWQRCTLTSCTSTGGTAATYVLTNADVGRLIRVAVTPANEDAPMGVSAETTPVLPSLHR
jgi:predicted actin-binding protein